ncbi:MAG: MFS transporter [Pseudomonas sp.]|uniref:MFS transporter n=1 Tax=Pseudomonas sp. TaxID=306 RepID=UPI003392A99A
MNPMELRATPSTWSLVLALPGSTRYLLLGICLSRMAASMVWPFVAVAMNRRFGTPISEIGAQLALGALIAIALAPLCGVLGDRFNGKHLMLGGCALAIGCFLLMGLFPGQRSYFIAIIGVSVAHSILEPLVRVALGDGATTAEERSFLFHVRYYLVNLAVALGPLAGMWFANRESDLVFPLAACGYLLLAASIAAAPVPRPHSAAESAAGGKPPLRQILRAILASKLFLAILVANFFLVFIYAQNDEPLTFYLLSLQVEDINRIIALISFTNTAVVLVVHLFLMRWLIALDEKLAYGLALACLMVGHGIIASNFAAWWGLWLLAIGFSTLAEIIVMPLFATLSDQLAPAGMRGSFIGISMLSGLGAALAPLLGALAIERFGGALLFALMAAACLPIGLLGYRVLHACQPKA